MKKLEGKWALVTGSARGIGQQIAMGLAREGCNVIVHGRKKENCIKTLELLKEYGIKTDVVEGKLSKVDDIEKMIGEVKKNHNCIDILYNNAAIQNKWKEIYDITLDEWKETFMINFYSIVMTCNAFAPGMKERGFGRIINLTSGIKDIPQLAPYSVSKAAVDKYSMDLAADLRGTGVLVNFLDPGWLKTDLGGENAMHEVTTVLPGALVPALLDNDGDTGKFFCAQDFREDK